MYAGISNSALISINSRLFVERYDISSNSGRMVAMDVASGRQSSVADNRVCAAGLGHSPAAQALDSKGKILHLVDRADEVFTAVSPFDPGA